MCFATFLPFRAPGSSFFWDFLFSDLLSSALLFSILLLHLCFSSVHIVGSLTSKLPSKNIYIKMPRGLEDSFPLKIGYVQGLCLFGEGICVAASLSPGSLWAQEKLPSISWERIQSWPLGMRFSLWQCSHGMPWKIAMFDMWSINGTCSMGMSAYWNIWIYWGWYGWWVINSAHGMSESLIKPSVPWHGFLFELEFLEQMAKHQQCRSQASAVPIMSLIGWGIEGIFEGQWAQAGLTECAMQVVWTCSCFILFPYLAWPEQDSMISGWFDSTRHCLASCLAWSSHSVWLVLVNGFKDHMHPAYVMIPSDQWIINQWAQART